MSNPGLLLQELHDSAAALDKGANRLFRLTREFEGEGEGDAWTPGPQLRWLELVGDKLDELATEYEQKEKRPPAKEVLQVRAEKRARLMNPALYADYHRLHSEIAALGKWISAKKETISARQSELRAEGLLAGVAPQRVDGQTFGRVRA